MRFLALVTDYDGTLATGGRVDAPTFEAITRLRRSGRRVVLVTGRRLDDLLSVCPALEHLDSVVLENGALLYDPRTREETILAPPAPESFVRRLRELNVEPIALGKVIVDTRLPHQTAVLQAIQEQGLELHIASTAPP
jgi:HAD superfamily hydrolase (TIGR01484 family)